MKNFLAIVLLLSCITTNAQWIQIGQDIDGEAAGDRSGNFYGVSLSADGSVVAIGAVLNDGNGTDAGHVRVYENNSGTWTQVGQDIDGEAAGDHCGRVSLSADGSVVAIGAPYNGGDANGHVRIYENMNGTWTQIGQEINGEAYDDQMSFVSLNSDGSVVAIGAPRHDGNGNNSGRVKVYQNSSGTWTQVGQAIDGEAAGDQAARVSLNADGSVVAIGAPGNDGNGTDAGHVRVYENISGTWTQVGQDIDGEATDDRFGAFLSISSDGSVVAIGARNNDGNGSNSGSTRVYQNNGGTWTQVGQDIDGEAAEDQAARVSISADGSVVAIGAPFNDGNGTDAGHVRVYENISGTWTQVGQDIDGEATGDESGDCVSLSSDGSVVAIGAWYNDGNGTDAGHVRIYTNGVLTADFEADNEVICAGNSVNFTNLSTGEDAYDWTFEGGTPTTSSDENPSVFYDTPGSYDVTLEVSNGDETDTEYKQDYIHVLVIPGQADVPDGESSVCTSQYYEYVINPVLYAQDYEWELSPSDAGSLIPDDTSAQLLVADDWNGDFTVRARATNICGDGDWSDNFEGTVYQSPDVFSLTGGGGYCLNGDGVEITLDGSETDVDYELYLDGIATGNIVSGTGSEISFGLITDEGYYTCIASNDNCVVTMNEQIQVEILFPPLAPDIPTGPEVICNDTTSDYESSGSDDADSYEWVLSPEEAGTITGYGLEATVDWNMEFSGIALISLYGVNECGDGNSSEALEVSVGAPNPVITGQSMVCDWSEEMYEVADNEGSTYTWEALGGNISEGQGTSEATVSWESEGNGTLIVSEININGCEGSSEIFDVTIDDCTSLDEQHPEKLLAVYPNPARNQLTVEFNSDKQIQYTVEITDMTGRKITGYSEETHPGKNSRVMDLKQINPGIYLVTITMEGNRWMKKLIRQ